MVMKSEKYLLEQVFSSSNFFQHLKCLLDLDSTEGFDEKIGAIDEHGDQLYWCSKDKLLKFKD